MGGRRGGGLKAQRGPGAVLWIDVLGPSELFSPQPCSTCQDSAMTKEEDLPDWNTSKEFYEKYEPKEVLGR